MTAIFLIPIWIAIIGSSVYLLSQLPLPSWVDNLSSYSLPPEILFWIEPFELDYGLSIISSAYLIRFLIRRLPIIG